MHVHVCTPYPLFVNKLLAIYKPLNNIIYIFKHLTLLLYQSPDAYYVIVHHVYVKNIE
jgi:hypothetical protein